MSIPLDSSISLAGILLTGQKSRKIKWKSTDLSILQVDSSGRIRTLGLGKAAILVDSGEISLQIRIDISVKERLLTQEITIDPNKVETIPGGTFSLKANVLINGKKENAVQWKSFKPEVVTVNVTGGQN
mgnify:CR=1 FL=1